MPSQRTMEYENDEDVLAWRQAKRLLKTNPSVGFSRLHKLAEEGSLLASLEIGRSFWLGIGTAKNLDEAERWFKRVAAVSSVRGHHSLGRLLVHRRRYEEEIEELKFSAARGFAPALLDLGKIYFLGLGVFKDVPLSISYLQRAAEGGSIFAKRLLGRILLESATDLKTKIRGIVLIMTALCEFIPALLREGPDSDSLRT
jgi:TPR repeat protein